MTSRPDCPSAIAEYFDLAENIHRSITRKCPVALDHDNLRGVALAALSEANEKYDGRIPFRPYAIGIIRNRIYDELRRCAKRIKTQTLLDGPMVPHADRPDTFIRIVDELDNTDLRIIGQRLRGSTWHSIRTTNGWSKHWLELRKKQLRRKLER